MVEYRQNPSGMKFSMVYRKPMNVGLVAKICQVSKKTVLNWIYKDALKAFTTYGGHYRVWPSDLNDFIQKTGLDVPFNFVDERSTSFLIVDDDIAYTMLLKEIICTEFPNANIITTDNGYEALILIGEKKPNVVLLDLRMPKIDGFQVLELLKKRNKDRSTKIVVLSGYIDEDAKHRLADSIADEVWEKGKSIMEMRRDLKRLFEKVPIKKKIENSI